MGDGRGPRVGDWPQARISLGRGFSGPGPGAPGGPAAPGGPPAVAAVPPAALPPPVRAAVRDVHFEFDRYDLTEETKRTLEELAQALKAHRGFDVLIEGHFALRDLDWSMCDGENWAVVGPNGAGKSTFLRLLAGEAHPAPGGRIRRLDLPERHGVFEVKARLGMVAPRLQAEHRLEATGEEVVLSGFFASVGLGDEPGPAQRAAAARWMDRLGLSHLARRGIQALSYGELRRLLLARALVRDPEVLLLDEPWNGLDAQGRAAMMALAQHLAAAGTRLVLVTHHEYEIPPAVNRLLELREGRAVYAGPWPRS